MNDKHHNEDFEQAFDDLFDSAIPEADKKAKADSIENAMDVFSQETFSQQNTQGIHNPARPIDKPATKSWLVTLVEPIWSLFMKIPTNRMAYGTFGTLAVAFIAVSLFYVAPPSPTNQPAIITGRIDENSVVVPVQLEATTVTQGEGERNEKTSGSDNLFWDRDEPQNDLEELIESPDVPETAVSSIPKPGRKDIKKLLTANDSTKAQEQTFGSGYSSETMINAEQPTSNQVAPRLIPLERRSSETLKEIVVTGSSAQPTKPKKRKRARVQSIRQKHVKSFENLRRLLVEESMPTPRADDREEYAEYHTNPIKQVTDEPVSTFSIDVDTASYSLIRNQLNSGYLPKPQAVRAEEFINYFDYDYPLPKSKQRPFETSVSVFDSPWNEGRKLLHIGIKGYDIAPDNRPDSNLVFLLDVSGSMSSANKLPLVKQSVALLLNTLKPTDTVSIVVYAGAAGTVLEPTEVKHKDKILAALQRLNAGGSTAGGAGIKLAYQLAEQNFDIEAVNRIILATDGDFNVGQSSNEDLKTLVERKRDSGVFLSILGFGRNNYQDDMMQTLAQNGNGVAAYIDTLGEAKKVLVDEASSTLFPIAKDVKIQVEFNPAAVSEYRLVGYETRHLNREDFNNDKVDAGDIGAGHTVTAIYEITPANAENKAIDEPRYQQNKRSSFAPSKNTEYGFLKIRYKLPTETKSKLIEHAISMNTGETNGEAHFSIAVAGFAQLLANSKHTGSLSYDDVIATATKYKGDDAFGYRSEFIQLVRMAKIAQP
jgi:Ca-activated chloride channel family protein